MPSQNSDLRENLVKYASFILNRRPYFRHTLRQKLINRSLKLKFTDYGAVVESLLDDLSASGYLNDSYLAEAFVRRQLAKGYGPRIIKLKLSQLKLANNTISESLASEATSSELLSSARAFLNKKRYLDQRKATQSLYQRGYDQSTIRRLFDSFDPTD